MPGIIKVPVWFKIHLILLPVTEFVLLETVLGYNWHSFVLNYAVKEFNISGENHLFSQFASSKPFNYIEVSIQWPVTVDR
jgi:hypothetical protein